jgi:hypothetical protein
VKFRPNLSPSAARGLAAPVVPLGMTPRLPTQPIQPYDPPIVPLPAPPPVPLAGFGDGSELWTQQYPFPYPPNQKYGGGQIVYTTHKRFEACDVYVDLPNLNTQTDPLQGAIISIYVFAISQAGQRTIVASGRLRDNAVHSKAVAQGAVVPPTWVASARSVAQRYQVMVGVYVPAGVIASTMPPINVTVVASDQANDSPPLIGAMRTGSGGLTAEIDRMVPAVDLNVYSNPAIFVVPQPELIGLLAVNGAGGTFAAPVARFLQYFENDGVLNAGDTPQMEWPMGNVDGEGLVDWNVRWRSQVDVMRFRFSSTPQTFTSVTDCFMQVFVR